MPAPPLPPRRRLLRQPRRRLLRQAEPAADPVKGKTIGFINAGPDDYYAQFGKTLKAVAETYGMNVIEVNSDYKPEKELANVQDLAAKGVDAIAVITAGAAGSAASIKAANDANIPIFFIAGKPELPPGGDLTGHVTDNFVILGYQIGPVGRQELSQYQVRGNPRLPRPGAGGRPDRRLPDGSG